MLGSVRPLQPERGHSITLKNRVPMNLIASLILTVSALAATPEHTPATRAAELDGMYFNSEAVVDWLWYGTESDPTYYVVYDDADSELYYETIRVDRQTYWAIVAASEAATPIEGTLVAEEHYGVITYKLTDAE